MHLPPHVQQSRLCRRLSSDDELLVAVGGLRRCASALAETISRSVPSFTDHSVRHMDALWAVADRVLTEEETGQLTSAEAFLLATGFYLHDIGMAYAANDAGLARLRGSPQYATFIRMARSGGIKDPDAWAISAAVRSIHAHAAEELATHPVLGTDVYLFESRSVREQWAATCGELGASHHWDLDVVEQKFGRGKEALPGGRTADLGYVAGLLRIIDYAHINRERAPSLDRAFRTELPEDSLVHWLAQESVDGPERDANELIYRSARAIENVDAWWLYFEMLAGLDAEIRRVRRYVDDRVSSQGRLSLQGVRGAASPQDAAAYIRTSGFVPIEVNLRAGSIERLVRLLAGESLYGPDPMAAVRELVANARDAVLLKAAVATDESERASLSIPIRVSLRTGNGGSPGVLEVTDWGVGMSRKVVTDYLITIASDYWGTQCISDFPDAHERGFKPAGKFGIGFLSVFMLGDSVIVESNRAGAERLQLSLRGLGRRGQIRVLHPGSGSGTKVRIELKAGMREALAELPRLLRAYAPLLPHPIDIDVDGDKVLVEPGWLRSLTAEDFRKAILDIASILQRGPDEVTDVHRMRRLFGRQRDGGNDVSEWHGSWPEYATNDARLQASEVGLSILCVRGLSLQLINTPGFLGIIEMDSAVPDAARRRAIHADVTEILEAARNAVRPAMVAHIDRTYGGRLMIDYSKFLARAAGLYGDELLRGSRATWIHKIRLPGEIELVDTQTLFATLVKKDRVFFSFGTGPWTAMRDLTSLDDGLRADDPGVVLGQEMVRSQPEYVRDMRQGALAELWPDVPRYQLFGLLIRLTAEAWQVGVEELLAQPGWRHDGSKVWGAFRR